MAASAYTWIILYLPPVILFVTYFIIEPLFLNPLSKVPGPKLYALTRWRLAYNDWNGTRTPVIDRLHRKYGPSVRIGPNEVSFNDLSALRTIYGPGSQYGRTSFYRMFDVYGKQNLFTFHDTSSHGQRKKLLSHAYSKSTMLTDSVSGMIEDRAHKFMKLIESEPNGTSEIFNALHYYSLDNITGFLYGEYGSTNAIQGNQSHRGLITDVLDPARRRLSWFAVHFPAFTKWLYTRTGLVEGLVQPFLPMQKPATYTGIRKFALEAVERFRSSPAAEKGSAASSDGQFVSILEKLWKYHESQKQGGLDDLEVASECADHFLAGIDTTSDTLMFLIWALSKPENAKYQAKLKEEVRAIPSESMNDQGLPKVIASDRCVYLNAVIKETLRLYAPLPANEPRSRPVDSVINGYSVPSNTVVGMAPYSLHRNADIFEDPLVFNPERWFGPRAVEMNRWFWAFSSGGRMCIGLHLAMAEMTTLAAAIYRQYHTSLAPGFDGISPGITSRFEVFCDETSPVMMEHHCLIKFEES